MTCIIALWYLNDEITRPFPTNNKSLNITHGVSLQILLTLVHKQYLQQKQKKPSHAKTWQT